MKLFDLEIGTIFKVCREKGSEVYLKINHDRWHNVKELLSNKIHSYHPNTKVEIFNEQSKD